MKLRALRKLLDKGGQIYIRSAQDEWSDINYFGCTPENSRLIEYEDRKECSKHIDRLISKHGADALISEIFNKGDSNEDLTKGGREGPSSEASEEGPSSTDSSTDTADHSDGMDCRGLGSRRLLLAAMPGLVNRVEGTMKQVSSPRMASTCLK